MSLVIYFLNIFWKLIRKHTSGDATILTIYTEDDAVTIEYSIRDYIAKAYFSADREFKNLLNTLWV